MDKVDDLLKRPLYVFDLPPEIVATLQLDAETESSPAEEAADPVSQTRDEAGPQEARTSAKLCSTCRAPLQDASGQRQHVKTDWHRYNLKQKLRGQEPVDEATFDRLIGELDESLSGSDSESASDEERSADGDTALAHLLRKQAKLSDAAVAARDSDALPQKVRSGSPYIWFTSPALPPDHRLGVYRALFPNDEQQKPDLAAKQLKPYDARQLAKRQQNAADPIATEPQIFLCMIGGGHFAAMVVSLTPKLEKKPNGMPERQAVVVAHKTFHRYTTRRKQGGSQSANDAAKGNAHSAGAGIRRANEAALEVEVRGLLAEWAAMIKKCQLLFVRATGMTNRRTLFGPYEKQVLAIRDPRMRSFPFTTRRATQSELMRAFVELTRAKITTAPEAPPPSQAGQPAKTTPAPKAAPPKPSKEEEEALLHTSQIQALIRRSKVPALLKYFASNSISPDFRFQPASSAANRHASTPLHLAASNSSPIMVSTLLTKLGADPTVQNGEDKVAFDVASDRATRDAFRSARFELGEKRWDWDKAHCPKPITKEEAEAREKAQQADQKSQEAERRRAELERIEKANAASGNSGRGSSSKAFTALEVTAADRREQEARGMTPEQKQRLERERRARAAEERIRRMASGQ